VVEVAKCSSVVVSGTENVVVSDCSPAGVVCGRAVCGRTVNVVEVARCSSVVVSGAEDVTPACSTDNSVVKVEGGLQGFMDSGLEM